MNTNSTHRSGKPAYFDKKAFTKRIRRHKQEEGHSNLGPNLDLLWALYASVKKPSKKITHQMKEKISGIKYTAYRYWATHGDTYPTYDHVLEITSFFRKELDIPMAVLNTVTLLTENLGSAIITLMNGVDRRQRRSEFRALSENWGNLPLEDRIGIFSKIKAVSPEEEL